MTPYLLLIDSSAITPTTLGAIASFYYLKHSTVGMLSKALVDKLQHSDLLRIMSNASEFAEVQHTNTASLVKQPVIIACRSPSGTMRSISTHSWRRYCLGKLARTPTTGMLCPVAKAWKFLNTFFFLCSPHTKANLLLQARFERCELPVVDYQTDTKTVLDQTFRVLQVHLPNPHSLLLLC
jgi:activating signal cointegrator complex subunit 3